MRRRIQPGHVGPPEALTAALSLRPSRSSESPGAPHGRGGRRRHRPRREKVSDGDGRGNASGSGFKTRRPARAANGRGRAARLRFGRCRRRSRGAPNTLTCDCVSSRDSILLMASVNRAELYESVFHLRRGSRRGIRQVRWHLTQCVIAYQRTAIPTTRNPP